MEEKIEYLPNDFKLATGDHKGEAEKAYVNQSYWQDVFRRFCANKGALIGLVLIVFILLFAIIGPMVSGYTYREVNAKEVSLTPRIPGLENMGIFNGYDDARSTNYHWCGTDNLGRDLFTRFAEGTRVSFEIAFLAVLVDVVLGVVYGLVSGYFGGVVDMCMQRVTEVLNSIPTMIVVTLLLLIMKPGMSSIVIAMMLTGWINMSRIVRAQVLKQKEMEFVLAARTLGEKNISLIFKEILPNVTGQIIVTLMFSIPNAIFMEAFLAFIGLGIPAPMASLGSLINDGYKNATIYPHMVVIPVIILALLMLSFNLVADGLRDAIDPQMKTM